MRKILSLLYTLLAFHSAYAKVDPALHWSSIETNHFEVIYPDHLQSAGHEIARKAEIAYDLLIPIFKEAPDKTVIVVRDDADRANGYAHFLPLPTITLNLTTPSEFDLFYYDDWDLLLLIHEYTHILNLHSSHGFYVPLKYIFGNVIRPNALLPRWYLEGLGVLMESELTAAGRLKSLRLQSILRTLALTNNLKNETIDQINETSVPRWPQGLRPYIFGPVVMQALYHQGGPNVIYELNQQYSRRFPFLLNQPIIDRTQKNYSQILKHEYQSITEKSKIQLQEIKKGTIKKKKSFKQDSNLLSPRISTNLKHMVYIEEEHGRSIIWLLSRTNNQKSFIDYKPQKLHKGSGIQEASWHPHDSKFIFAQLNQSDRYNTIYDIYEYNLGTSDTKQLTQGSRAQQPVYSLDGRSIFYLRNNDGLTSVVEYSLFGKGENVLFTSEREKPILSLAVRNSNELFVTIKNKLSHGELYTIDLHSKVLERRLQSYFDLRHINQTKMGLTFVSDKNGVPNLYLADSELNSANPITNSFTQIFNGDLDTAKNEIIVSELSAKGLRLNAYKYTGGVRISQVSPLWPENSTQKSNLSNSNLSQARIHDSKPYRTFSYLVPRYWVPFIYPIEGGTLIQGTTQASDPLDLHGYVLNASYDDVTDKPSYGVIYYNQMTSVTPSVQYTRINQYFISSDVLLEKETSSGGLQFDLAKKSKWSALIGYSHESTDYTNINLIRAGPSLALQHQPFEMADNKIQFLLMHHKFLDGDKHIEYDKSTARMDILIQSMLPKSHSMQISAKGAYAPGLKDTLGHILFFGDSTANGVYSAGLLTPNYLMRGYPSGTFLSRSFLNTTFSYNLSAMSIYKGSGTLPLYFRDVALSLFADAITLDGYTFDSDRELYQREKNKDIFAGTGAEIIFNTTAAYHMPLALRLGLHYGLEDQNSGGFKFFLALGLGTFETIDLRTQ